MKLWMGAAALIFAGGAAAATLGQVGRDAAPQLDRLPAWAGGRPDVSACEAYVRSSLDAPTTYRRAAIERVDSDPLTPDAFDQAAGIGPAANATRRPRVDALDRVLAESDRLQADMARLERERAAGRELRLRRMTIAYDADNAAGVPIRGDRTCLFRIIDGQLDATATLADRAGRDGAQDLDAMLALAGRDPVRRRRSPVACCL